MGNMLRVKQFLQVEISYRGFVYLIRALGGSLSPLFGSEGRIVRLKCVISIMIDHISIKDRCQRRAIIVALGVRPHDAINR